MRLIVVIGFANLAATTSFSAHIYKRYGETQAAYKQAHRYAPSDDNDVDPEFLSGKFPMENGRWVLENDFDLFLNQCTIQSFMYLLKSLRDPRTVMWMENFVEPSIDFPSQPDFYGASPQQEKTGSKLLLYHGIGAINTTIFPSWDSFFFQLLEQAPETLIVESDMQHVPSYELDIKPASLCSRMISVREQIAEEFVGDLDVIASLGGLTLEDYWSSMKDLEGDREHFAPDGSPRVRQSFIFLEYDPYYGQVTSPLRKGNFDLLLNLATQESIHRVLNADPDSSFLQTFYLQRWEKYFGGAQPYGRSDDFFQELLSHPASVIQVSEESTVLVDPTHVAETILRERAKVAKEWKVKASSVPDLHTDIRKQQFDLLLRAS